MGVAVLGDYHAGALDLVRALGASPLLQTAEDNYFFGSASWYPQAGSDMHLKNYPLMVGDLHMTAAEFDAGIRIVEAGFEYTNSRPAPRRMRELLPGLRVVMVVRAPEDRMFANFLSECMEEREGAFIYKDGRVEHVLYNAGEDWKGADVGQRLPNCSAESFHEYVKTYIGPAMKKDERTLLHKHYMAFRSLIDRDAEIWHRMFRCDLYVLDFADFARAPLEATNDIMSWLGLPLLPAGALQSPADLPAMLPESRRVLRKLFAPSIARFESFFPGVLRGPVEVESA